MRGGANLLTLRLCLTVHLTRGFHEAEARAHIYYHHYTLSFATHFIAFLLHISTSILSVAPRHLNLTDVLGTLLSV